MKLPQLLISTSLAMLGFSGVEYFQDPINDMADFYYAGANDELAAEALLKACQKNPTIEEASESEHFTNYVAIVTDQGLKFSIGPKMSSDEGLDRFVIIQVWNAADEISEETGAVFCNEVNKANNLLSFTYHDGYFQSESNISFPNLLRAEHLVESLLFHRTVIQIALEGAYPDDGWKNFIK